MTYVAPVVTCEVAFGFSPLSLPSGGDWVALDEVVAEFEMDRGKQDQLGEHQPAQVTIVLDNGDTDLDQSLPASLGNTAWNSGTAYTAGSSGVTYNGRHYNSILNGTNHVPPNATYWVQSSQAGGSQALPFTPIRIKVDGTVLWTGYTTSGWEPSGGEFGAATVTVDCTDWLGWAATKMMPESLWAAWVTRERPRLWIRGDMEISQPTTSSDAVYNMAQLWTGAYGDMTPNTGTYDGYLYRVAGIAAGAGGYALRESYNTTWASIHADGADIITATNVWSVAFWMKADTPQVQYYGTNGGGDEWWFDTNASGHLNANVMVGGATYTATVAADHCDGTAHVILCHVVSTGGSRGVYLATDLGSASQGFVNSGASGGGQIELNGRDESIVGEFCYWDSGAGGYKASAPTPGWFAEPEPGAGTSLATQASRWDAQDSYLSWGDTRAERLAVLGELAVCAVPTARITVDDAAEGMWTYVAESTLADAVRVLGTSWLGDVFMERDGELRIYDVSYTSATAADYTTVHALITDEDGATGPPTVIRASGGARTGSRLERVVNDVRVDYTAVNGDEEVGVYYFDLDSQQRYGVKRKSWTSQSGTRAPTLVADYLAAHKDPAFEVRDVVIQPWGNQDYTDWVLDTLELERRVTYRKALPLPSSAEIIDADYRIIGEQWTWRNGAGDSADDWTVTLRLEPV